MFAEVGRRARSRSVSSVAWLGLTVVTNLCLDQLKSARARREEVPRPLAARADWRRGETLSVTASLSQTAGAFLVSLKERSLLERAVYVLHDVFDHRHAEIAAIVGKEEAACRQLHHRARERLREGRPRFAPSATEHERLLLAFVRAVEEGDLDGLTRILAGGRHPVGRWRRQGGRRAPADPGSAGHRALLHADSRSSRARVSRSRCAY